jgi:hypothetical protein
MYASYKESNNDYIFIGMKIFMDGRYTTVLFQ